MSRDRRSGWLVSFHLLHQELSQPPFPPPLCVLPSACPAAGVARSEGGSLSAGDPCVLALPWPFLLSPLLPLKVIAFQASLQRRSPRALPGASPGFPVGGFCWKRGRASVGRELRAQERKATLLP